MARKKYGGGLGIPEGETTGGGPTRWDRLVKEEEKLISVKDDG